MIRMIRDARYSVAALLSVGLSTACVLDLYDDVACTDIGIPIMVVSVRDQHGTPSAIGSTIEIEDDGFRGSGEGYGDSLRIWTEEYARPGTYRLTVSRPWHETAVVRDVRVPGGPCGVEQPHEVEATLVRVDAAPSVRQVVLPPVGYGFGGGNFTARLRAHVVRDDGVFDGVLWSSTDTSVVEVDSTGLIRSACRASPGEAWVRAVSIVDPGVSDSVSVSVDAQSSIPTTCP